MLNWEADKEEQLPAQVSKPGRRRTRRRGASPRGSDVRDLHGNLQGGRGASCAPVPASLPRKVNMTCTRCVYLPVDIQHTQCLRRFFNPGDMPWSQNHDTPKKRAMSAHCNAVSRVDNTMPCHSSYWIRDINFLAIHTWYLVCNKRGTYVRDICTRTLSGNPYDL